MPRLALLILVLFTGCTDESQPVVIDESLSGSYLFKYEPPGGMVVSDEHDDGLFVSPTTVPQCCLAVARYDTTIQLEVGNWLSAPTYPVNGACPAVAFAVIRLYDVPMGPQTFTLDASTASVVMYYQEQLADPNDPADPCPRMAEPQPTNQLSEPITLSGQVKLADLRCDGGSASPDECALDSTGSWAIEGIDNITGTTVLTTSGTFQSGDTIGSF